MYKQAAELKLRIQTERGSLTVEQIMDLPLTELDKLAVALEKDYKESKGKSFLDKKTTKDKTLKLKFDIVLDILETKVAAQEAEKQKADDKAHNEKILTLIADKQDEELKGKSVKQLMDLLR